MRKTNFHTPYSLLTLLLIYSTTIGCEKSNWQHSLDSPEQIGLAVVEALNRQDIDGLNRLRIQRQKYLQWIWPAFPASRPPSNFPADFAWENLNKKCNLGMQKWITRYGGQNLKFIALRCDQPQEKYRKFQLLRGTVLTLQDAKGEKHELHILGSIIVKNNRYKLLSYQD